MHALRNALIPVVTVIGLQVGVLFAGAILTETIFAWPGIGKWLIESVARRDYPVLQGGVLLVAAVVMIVNLLVDLTYGVLNPRIRHGGHDHDCRIPIDATSQSPPPRRAALGRAASSGATSPRTRAPSPGSVVIVVAALLLAIFADLIAPHSPNEQFRDAILQPPFWAEGGSSSSCSAPTTSAATSCRASSMAPACRC